MEMQAGVMEMQGLYGPYFVTERLIQQIWSRGDFERGRATTEEGEAIQVLGPGRWNRLGGPDFLRARLRIQNVVTEGDVEVHAREEEWRHHGHGEDPAYANVVLHVVLFPPKVKRTEISPGRTVPILCLLPLLLRDLEDFAADAAVERLAAHPLRKAHDGLLGLDPVALRTTLKAAADQRWDRKLARVRESIDRWGWSDACHRKALEVLGALVHRGAMRAVAEAHPLSHWEEWARRESWPWPEILENGGSWANQGLRPASRPLVRLGQYAEWVRRVPDWPVRLRRWEAPVAFGGLEGAGERGFAGWRDFSEQLNLGITGGVVGGSRKDTLVCDAFLPLLAAGGSEPTDLWRRAWFHAPPGDAPDAYVNLLKSLQVVGGEAGPRANGWVQGLIGWFGAQKPP